MCLKRKDNTQRDTDLLFVTVACKRTSDKVTDVRFVDALNNEMCTTGMNGRVMKTRKLRIRDDERSQRKSNGVRTRRTDQKPGAERNALLIRNPVVSHKGANTGCC